MFTQENSHSLTERSGEEVFFPFAASQSDSYEPDCEKMQWTQKQGTHF